MKIPLQQIINQHKLKTAVYYGIQIVQGKIRIGHCGCCRRIGLIARRRLCTAYVDDEQNWLTSCKSCFNETNDLYHEMWEDYYATRF